MAQGYLTKLSNYCLCRSAFKCSNPQKTISVTPTRNLELKQEHQISDTLLGLNVAQFKYSRALSISITTWVFMLSWRHKVAYHSYLPEWPDFMCLHLYTRPRKEISMESPLPFKHPLPEERPVAHWFLGYTPDWPITCCEPVWELYYVNSM